VNKLGIWVIVIAITTALIVGTLSSEPFAEAGGFISVAPFADEYVIASENTPGGKIFYLPSNFDGTFGTPTFMTDIGLRSGTGIGDFDNDGDLDFVAGTRQSSCPLSGVCVSYYLFENLGGGNFDQKLIDMDVPGGATLIDNVPAKMAIADYNEDGFNDFVSGVYRSDFVYLFTNNQDNTFSRSSLPTLPNPTDAKSGDFNEDGHIDFLITEYFAASVHMYEGDGTGAFTKQFLFMVPVSGPGTRAASLAVGDYNEDGHLDVIVDDIRSHVAHMYFGDGFGNFALQGNAYVRSVQTNVDAFDFDKDGHQDLVISDWDNVPSPSVYFKKGNGDGTFQPESVVATLPSKFLIVSAPPPIEEPPVELTKEQQEAIDEAKEAQQEACDEIQEIIDDLIEEGIPIPAELQQIFDDNCT